MYEVKAGFLGAVHKPLDGQNAGEEGVHPRGVRVAGPVIPTAHEQHEGQEQRQRADVRAEGQRGRESRRYYLYIS